MKIKIQYRNSLLLCFALLFSFKVSAQYDFSNSNFEGCVISFSQQGDINIYSPQDIIKKGNIELLGEVYGKEYVDSLNSVIAKLEKENSINTNLLFNVIQTRKNNDLLVTQTNIQDEFRKIIEEERNTFYHLKDEAQKNGTIEKTEVKELITKQERNLASAEHCLQNDFEIVVEKNKETGKLQLGFRWDAIKNDPNYIFMYDFSEGLARIRQANKFGFLDENGNYLIEPKYDYADDFRDDIAIVKNLNNWFFINKKGDVILTIPNVTEIVFIANNSYRCEKEKKHSFYLINKKGDKISDDYYKISETIDANNLLKVEINSGGGKGLIHVNGDCYYKNADVNSIRQSLSVPNIYIINIRERITLYNFAIDKIIISNAIAYIMSPHNSIMFIEKIGEDWKYCDFEGIPISKKTFSVAKYAENSNFIVGHKKKNTFGIINSFGSFIVEFNKFTKIDNIENSSLSNSFKEVQKQGKYGIIKVLSFGWFDFLPLDYTKIVYNNCFIFAYTSNKIFETFFIENDKLIPINVENELNINNYTNIKYLHTIDSIIRVYKAGYHYLLYNEKLQTCRECKNLITSIDRNGLMICQESNQYLINSNLSKVSDEYNTISFCDNGMYSSKIYRGYGFLNSKGKLQIEMKYDSIENQLWTNNTMIVCNWKKEEIGKKEYEAEIEDEYVIRKINDISIGYDGDNTRYYDTYFVMKGKYGVVNESGCEFIQPIFDKVTRDETDGFWVEMNKQKFHIKRAKDNPCAVICISDNADEYRKIVREYLNAKK